MSFKRIAVCLLVASLLFVGSPVSSKDCGHKAIKKCTQRIRKSFKAEGYCALYRTYLDCAMSIDLSRCGKDDVKEYRLVAVVVVHLRSLGSRCTDLVVPSEYIEEVKQYRTSHINVKLVNTLLSDEKPDDASLQAIDKMFKCDRYFLDMIADRSRHNYCDAANNLFDCTRDSHDPGNALAAAWNEFYQTTNKQIFPTNTKDGDCQIL